MLGTGVTCPTIRIHPAIVAQAAATTAAMMPGRFFLGVGTGENLNEHVLGQRWPRPDVRREMLERGDRGDACALERRADAATAAATTPSRMRGIYTLPDEPPEVMVAAGGPKAAELAGGSATG